MIDLYKKLGIKSDSSIPLINEAIRNCRNPYIKEQAIKILLNKNRKRVFDRCNKSLNQIAQLRSALNLNHSPNWSEHKNNYFFKSRNHSEDKEPKKVNAQPTQKGYLVYWILAFIALTIFTPILFGIGNDSLNSTQDQSPAAETEFDADKFIEDVIQNDRNNNIDNQESSRQIIKDSFQEPEKPLPVHGYTRNFTDREAIAPLKIIPSAFSNHYFIKLDNTITGQKEFEFFIRNGRSIEVEVPLGRYELKYATGSTWYGVKHLFGPSGGVFKADEIFTFESNTYQVSGYTVELTERIGGNLSTTTLDASEW